MEKDNNKEKTKICNIINYEKDILPFPLVKIYSGVGSGKSYFASKMITGSKEHGIPEQNILIITSRRSKVQETLKEMGVLIKDKITKNGNLSLDVWQTGENRPDEYEKYLKEIKYDVPEFGELTYSTYNKSVVCTNAFISAYLRNIYNADDPTTHIWNKFDAIIIDEVHSLVTDATYQSATFDVLSLIHEYLKRYKNHQLQECACKHLILMTGTPEPFETLIKLDFPENLTNRMDLFDKCENVVPKNIILIDWQSSKVKIKELLSKGNKVIYFTNRTITETAVKEKFDLDDSICVGVSFSNDEKRKNLTQMEKRNIKGIDESLAKNSLIPEHIQFFVTTSRNKEGININNVDYQYMFVETHLMYDVVQMAGRVRCGIDTLYIISDAEPLVNGYNITDILFSKKIMVKNSAILDSKNVVNEYFVSAYLNNGIETQKPYEDRKKNIMHYVKYIESRFAYIRYNIFNHEFEFFDTKEDSEKLVETQKKAFERMLLSDSNKYIEEWFPDSVISRDLAVRERAIIYLNDVIGTQKFAKLSEEKLREHVSEIKTLFDSKLKSVNSILHLVDKNFNCKKSGNNYILYYGKEDPRIKKKAMRKRPKH